KLLRFQKFSITFAPEFSTIAMDLKELIIGSASNLFFRNGIKSTTMSEIANETGISKRTLYEVFNDKEDLLESCLWMQMQQEEDVVKDIISNSGDVFDTIMLFHLQQMNNMCSVGRTLFRDLRKYHRSLYDKMELVQDERIFKFIPLLEKSAKEGYIRNDMPFELLLWLMKRQLKTLMEDETIPETKYSFNEYINVMVLTFVRGISTQKGNEKIDEFISKKQVLD
ncbi:MAG: TetR/AcrR family transcriptional regulator, partial [Tannerella sp.]|nr:TetR/AcrR family transcriptional regulator [Tannerella sp.]